MTNTVQNDELDSDPRLQQLSKWLQNVFPDHPFTLSVLPGDASFRRYVRLYVEKDAAANATMPDVVADKVQPDAAVLQDIYIVMDAPPELESVTQFVAVTQLLIEAVNVPTIVAKDIEQGFLVLQDFGTTEFAHLIAGAPNESVNQYYQWAMQTLIDLQKIDIEHARKIANLPDYNAEMLNREMALFSDWFLPYINIELDNRTSTIWQDFTNNITTEILKQPKVVVHRDYHSRNLMRDQHNPDELGIIDFQDAVIGAYSYDLVSLVRDAYVDWDEAQVLQWIEDFWQLQQQAGLQAASDIQTFTQDVHVMGIQRHLKVLGIFIRLAERDGKQRYLADIPKVMQDLYTSLTWLNENGDNELATRLMPFYEWLNSEILPHTFSEK